MTPANYGNRPHSWTVSRPATDPCQRFLKHGPIRPMEQERTLIKRLLGL